MPPRAKKPAQDAAPGLRMKELMALTGLPKSTLLFYVEQGLLPAPVKTSPNMAYYHRACVERAAFIRDMQTRHRLPLHKIRHLLDLRDEGREVAPLVDLLHIIFGGRDEPLMDLEALCAASGLSREQVAALRQARLLLPLSEEGFDQQDLAAALTFASGLKRGIRVEDMTFYPELGQALVEREVALRGRLTRGLPLEQNTDLTMGMVQAARATRAYVIDRLFQLKIASFSRLDDPGEEP